MADINDKIREVVLPTINRDGEIDSHTALKKVMPLLSGWDKLSYGDDCSILAEEGARLRIKKIVCRAVAAMETHDEEQQELPFPGLRLAYALDEESEDSIGLDDEAKKRNILKQTRLLTRLEFKRLIVIREKGIIADTKHLALLKQTEAKLSPYWDRHPDWTFEQVEALYVQDRHNLFESASA